MPLARGDFTQPSNTVGPPASLSGLAASLPQVLCPDSPCTQTVLVLDSLAADIRPRRRRWRSVMVDCLHGVGLFRSLVIVLHALLEGLDALCDVAHQVRNLAAAEQQQDDCDHDDPVPNAKRTHPATLQTREASNPARPKVKNRLRRRQKQGL